MTDDRKKKYRALLRAAERHGPFLVLDDGVWITFIPSGRGHEEIKTPPLPGGASAAPGTAREESGERRFTAMEVRQAVWEEIMRELTHLDVSKRTERAYEVTGLVMAALEHYE